MCKLHGVRLIKGIKILKVCLTKTTVVLKQELSVTFKLQLTWSSISIQTHYCAVIRDKKCGLRFVYLAKSIS